MPKAGMHGLNYGGVVIRGGQFQDQCGYYDDDRWFDEIQSFLAVVYLDIPLEEPYIFVPHTFLTNIIWFKHEKWKKAHPDVVRRMDIQ